MTDQRPISDYVPTLVGLVVISAVAVTLFWAQDSFSLGGWEDIFGFAGLFVFIGGSIFVTRWIRKTDVDPDETESEEK